MKVSRRANTDRYYVAKIFGYGLFVHHIHHDEPKDTYHSHPWNCVSLIFGSYLEEKMGEAPRLRRFFNWIKADVHHRVTLPNGPVWTILVHARRCNRWTVKHRDGRTLKTEPWRGVGGPTSYVD